MLSIVEKPKSKEDITVLARIEDDGMLDKKFLVLNRNPTSSDPIYKDGYDIASIFKEEGCTQDNVSKLDNGVGKSIKLCDDSKFVMLPSANPEFPDRIFVIAKSGEGKSTLIGEYLMRYRKMFPQNSIYLISRKQGDKAFKDLDYITINVNDPQYDEEWLNMDDFPNNSAVVFDDTATYTKETLRKVNHLRDDLLQVGRSRNITVIATSHVYKDFENTKILWLESTHIALALRSQKKHAKDALISKLGFSPDAADNIFKLKGRFVWLSPSSPCWVVSDHEAHIFED